MSDARSKRDQVRFIFKRGASYALWPATGAYGGVTPTGHISVDFYVDRAPMPESVVHQLSESGQLGEGTQHPSWGSVVAIDREIVTGVLISADTAEAVANWLQEQANECRRRAANEKQEADR